MTEIQNNPKEAGVLRNSKVKNQKSKLQFKIQKEGTSLDSVLRRNDSKGRAWIPFFNGMTERVSPLFSFFLSSLRRQGSRFAFCVLYFKKKEKLDSRFHSNDREEKIE